MVSRGSGPANIMASINCAYFLVVIAITMALRIIDANTVHDILGSKATEEMSELKSRSRIHSVDITLLKDAVGKGAVCTDGSPPAYHLDRGFGSGENSWLVSMEGGGWCDNTTSCLNRARMHLGSSRYMGKSRAFSGILSNVQSRNPDFYNWNRVFVRYCDGSSFTGDVEEIDPVTKLHFRGQRIWQAVMQDLLAKGLDLAQQALLTGCSAGGLTTFIHCDAFRDLLPSSAQVKCMTDAGFFLDSKDVSGGHSFRSYFNDIVTLHGSLKHLPAACTSTMNPASLCFFPQYLLQSIKTPLFVVNTAYDSWQMRSILAPIGADPGNHWQNCRMNITHCAPWQLNIMQEFRDNMINALATVNSEQTGGLFINSCFAHCQTTLQVLWHSPNTSPELQSRTIAEAVGDWFFDRKVVKYIDCPYPCDSTCHSLL